MTIWSISLQNIKSKPLYTFLSIFILSLSIALLLGIQQIKSSFKNQIENNLSNIDLVVGAKGSPLQLVLASVLHLDNPTGNISYSEAMQLGKNPMVKTAIPISYGDNYKGFRIVGTTKNFLNLYNATLKNGVYINNAMEVVLGATVAKKLNLNIGDTFLSSHGFIENDIDVHQDEFTVVGILQPTQKVIDGLIITNLQSVWDVHHHENEEHHEDEHHHEDEEHHHEDEHHQKEHLENQNKEITSLLVTFKSKRALLTYPRKINETTAMQAALPILELNKLYNYTSVGFDTISAIAILILIISCITIFASFYKMVKERSFDLAILRTYGASNFQLIKMLLFEGFFIITTAFIIGYVFIRITLYFATQTLQIQYAQNIVLPLSITDVLEILVLVMAMVFASVVFAIYPITKMNISTILSHEK